jgi:sugar phosphate isomerase/epimerase
MAEIAESIQRRGFRLAYHNHDFEFKRLGGSTGMELLIHAFGSSQVSLELDVYWIAFAGFNPAAYISGIGSRLFSVHLKDMTHDSGRRFAPVGDGSLDFKSILSAASRCGAKFAVAEQDDCYGSNPLESIRRSYDYLNQLEWV